MISKKFVGNIFKKKKPKLIHLHKVKWFQVFLSNMNNYSISIIYLYTVKVLSITM